MIDFSSLTAFDYSILSIISISTIFAFYRGFIVSFLYFFGWIVSAIVVTDSYTKISMILQEYIKSQFLVNITSILGLFTITLIVVTVINYKLIALTKKIQGGALDRSLGFAFGFIRGCVISCALFWCLVTAVSAWNEKTEPEWLKKSQSRQLLRHGTNYIISLIIQDTNSHKLLKLIDLSNDFKFDNPKELIKEKIFDQFEKKTSDIQNKFKDEFEKFQEENLTINED